MKREEERLKERNSDLNKQTICVDLKTNTAFCGDWCEDVYLKSKEPVPDIVSTSVPQISTMDWFQDNISYIPFQKMKFIGYNKFLKNIIFVAIGPDKHVYLKSQLPGFENLSKIKLTGVFDDFIEAAGMACDNEGNLSECDPLEMEFPIDTYLVPELIDRVLRELVGATYRPKDSGNDARDDLSYIANFIRNYVKKPLQREIDGDQNEHE